MTPEQKKIIAWAKSLGGSFTKREAVEQFGGAYYYNGEKHVGDRISRMVAKKYLIRLAPGKFKISTGTRQTPSGQTDNQLNIFDHANN